MLEVPGLAESPLSERSRPESVMAGMWSYERYAWREGFRLVAGIDEAGRGPLAGPVVAACVLLPSDFDPAGINDSKALTAEQRDLAYKRIVKECHCMGVGIVPADIIDKLNIYHATHLAMLAAVEDCPVRLDLCLVDGLPVRQMPLPHLAVVKGDTLSVSIAAASIVAKVTRDRIMRDLDSRYPGYGFSQHKGYATVQHIQALSELGVCPEHRMSFHPDKHAPESASADQQLLLETDAV